MHPKTQCGSHHLAGTAALGEVTVDSRVDGAGGSEVGGGAGGDRGRGDARGVGDGGQSYRMVVTYGAGVS